jgi:hypothetical protein
MLGRALLKRTNPNETLRLKLKISIRLPVRFTSEVWKN